MGARKWTDEQRARQAEAIHRWKPWATSTGPTTSAGKQASSRNAVNYSLRAVMREVAQQNRELLAYLRDVTTTAPTFDRTEIDKLLDDLEKAVAAPATKPGTKTRRADRPAPARTLHPPAGNESINCDGQGVL